MATRFIIEHSKNELFTCHLELALVGLALNRFTNLERVMRSAIPLRHGISHGDLAKNCLGFL